MRASLSLLAGAALAALAGCDLLQGSWSSAVSFTLDRDRVSAGQTVVATFEKLADEDGRRFWIAVQRADAPITDTEGLVPIPNGAASMRVSTRGACACEVRVFMENKSGPSVVAARRKLRVVE